MPLIWLILGVALVVAEVFTATFVLLMFGIGALAAALVALLGAGAAWQALAFAGVSTLSLVLVRPGIQHFMHRHSPKTPMGLAAIEGGTALVLEEICADSGLVKIEGEIWRARPYDARQVIPAGEQVRVIEVDGATAMVWRD